LCVAFGYSSKLQGAIRELEEESSLNLRDPKLAHLIPAQDTTPFKVFHTGTGKTVKVFLITDPDSLILEHTLVHGLTCKSLIDNKQTPHLLGCPEIDSFKWITKDEAKAMVFKSQRVLFE